jgi:hypothetical protein
MANDLIRYRNIIVSLPDEWEDGTTVVVLGKPDGGVRANMVCSEEPAKAGETAAQFAANTLASLQTALTDYRLVKEDGARFGPNTGFLREHTFQAGGHQLTQLQFYVIAWDIRFTCTFTHLTDKFAAVRGTAEKLFTQIQFTKPAASTARHDDFYSS